MSLRLEFCQPKTDGVGFFYKIIVGSVLDKKGTKSVTYNIGFKSTLPSLFCGESQVSYDRLWILKIHLVQ